MNLKKDDRIKNTVPFKKYEIPKIIDIMNYPINPYNIIFLEPCILPNFQEANIHPSGYKHIMIPIPASVNPFSFIKGGKRGIIII